MKIVHLSLSNLRQQFKGQDRITDRVYALEILKYHTDRNYIAQKSHRKKAIAEANLLKIKVSL